MSVDVIFLFAIVFSNARVALRKGKSSWGWGLLTFASFMLAAFVGVVFIFLTTPHGPLLTLEDQRAFIDRLQQDVLKGITVIMFGLGGGLLIRYRLQRLPAVGNPNSPEE